MLIEQYLQETRLEESCGDDVVVGASLRLESMNVILVEAFDLIPTSSPLLHTIPSYVLILDMSQGNNRCHDRSIDPYCIYLERTCLRKSCGFLSLIILLIFLRHLIISRGH